MRPSTREWILIVLILMGGQYIVQNWTMGYGNDPNVLNYVSFAGTIVSIILAVLAIVYAFFQTFSQERSSNDIATQVDLLRKIVEDVRVSKNDFVEELERIDDIREKMDESLSLNRQSSEQVALIGSRLDAVSSSMELLRVPSPGARTEQEAISSELKRSLASGLAPSTVFQLDWIRRVAGKLSFADALNRYAEASRPEKTVTTYDVLERGQMAGMVTILVGLGLIRSVPSIGSFEVDEEFSAEVAAHARQMLESGPESERTVLLRLARAAEELG